MSAKRMIGIGFAVVGLVLVILGIATGSEALSPIGAVSGVIGVFISRSAAGDSET